MKNDELVREYLKNLEMKDAEIVRVTEIRGVLGVTLKVATIGDEKPTQTGLMNMVSRATGLWPSSVDSKKNEVMFTIPTTASPGLLDLALIRTMTENGEAAHYIRRVLQHLHWTSMYNGHGAPGHLDLTLIQMLASLCLRAMQGEAAPAEEA